jgi:enhancing lycopene biosynthesis protein 2
MAQDVNETSFDRKNLVFSTPAYMYGAAHFHEVDDGIGGMIKYMILTLKDHK